MRSIARTVRLWQDILLNLRQFLKKLTVARDANDNRHSSHATFQPRHATADVLIGQGNILEDTGRLVDALALYQEAQRVSPNHSRCHLNIGNAQLALGQSAAAIDAYREAIRIAPDNAGAYFNLANALKHAHQTDEAIAAYRDALRHDPTLTIGYNNLGFLLDSAGNLPEAEMAFRMALQLDQFNPDANTNLGLVLMRQGRFDEAEIYARKAATFCPDDPTLRWNLALLLLIRGDYDEGFRLYEKRLQCTKAGFTGSSPTWRLLSASPRWNGDDLSGKRLLVWTEQGFGDSIMMLRYLPLLKKNVRHLTIACEPTLSRLIQSIPSVDRTISIYDTDSFSDFDLHCPTMSLPFLFNTNVTTIPNVCPYLRVPDGPHDYRDDNVNHATLKVGIVWAGSKSIAMADGKTLIDETGRGIPLHIFKPLMRVEGTRWYSLQKGAAASQLDTLGCDVINSMDRLGDFMETAALVSELDLVITIDTAVAHLAGALGKPVWLFNRYSSDWRWGFQKEHSPWYPTMHIYNQEVPGEWKQPIENARQKLAEMALVRERNDLSLVQRNRR